jgi:hypothetical protein
LAGAIGEALALDPAAREALGRHAIAHAAAHFTREAMCANTIAVYEELLFPESSLGNEAEPVAVVA